MSDIGCQADFVFPSSQVVGEDLMYLDDIEMAMEGVEILGQSETYPAIKSEFVEPLIPCKKLTNFDKRVMMFGLNGTKIVKNESQFKFVRKSPYFA